MRYKYYIYIYKIIIKLNDTLLNRVKTLDIRFAEKEPANFFHTNIFNLTNDFKTIGIKKFVDKKYIAEEIANEIYRGINLNNEIVFTAN